MRRFNIRTKFCYGESDILFETDYVYIAVAWARMGFFVSDLLNWTTVKA